LTRAFVVVLGEPCTGLHEATRPGRPLANGAALALRQVPLDVQAVSEMAIPPTFLLAWIFVEASALASDALRSCQRRLGAIAPVSLGIHYAQGIPTQPPADLHFPGGVILQPYTDDTFPLVLTLITDFVAKSS
jgi:hypothetical protein